MTADILQALGGVGLFLFGMMWLTEGLRGIAGPTMRGLLARFTRTPLSGAVTGALTTAVIQSSSATTITAVGFVGAGLLTFPQALGVIFGANIGTTITGWLVAILGFKLQLGEVVLPVIFVAALLRLFGGNTPRVLGTALAGFCLIFIGIDMMQAGMAGFEGAVTPTSFPTDGFLARLQLLLIGVGITLVTQSSSAGVATALAALGVGAINFEQAAAMVIGMDVGTTFSAALATLGGATAARRTGLSHVIYNVLTGVLAFLLLGPFATLVAPLVEEGEAQIALVLFHSSFNLLGVILVIPFAERFARLVITLVPERGPELTRDLGRLLLSDPDAATDAASSTTQEIARAQFRLLVHLLERPKSRHADQGEFNALSDALAEARRFVDAIAHDAPGSLRARRIEAILHILDHLGRVYYRCTQTQRLMTLGTDRHLNRLAAVMRTVAAQAADADDLSWAEMRLNRVRRLLRTQRRTYRERLLGMASTGRIQDEEALLRLDALRWLHRVAYHLWRIEHHLVRLKDPKTPLSTRHEAAVDVLED